VKGVFKGIGRGLAGVVTKPIAGTVDFFSHLAIAGQVKMIGGTESFRC